MKIFALRHGGNTASGFGFRILSVLLVTLTLLAALALPVSADTAYPTPTDYIADDAAVLSESTVKEIKEKNTALAKDVKAVIAVCTIKTTSGVDIGKYARSVYTEWKLPAGVLILISSEDNQFYLVQSSGISDRITNENLEAIRDQEMEEDFSIGNIDRAVRKAVSRLSILMLTNLKAAEPEKNAEGTVNGGGTTTAPADNKKSGIGDIILGFLKTVLIIVLILVVLFIVVFVIAMFNDDVAAILQRTIFRRGRQGTRSGGAHYDPRLYGGQNAGRPQGPPQGLPQGQNGGYPGYPRNGNPQAIQQRGAQSYYGQSYGGQPYGNQPYGSQPYNNAQPYAPQPYNGQPYANQQPYARNIYPAYGANVNGQAQTPPYPQQPQRRTVNDPYAATRTLSPSSAPQNHVRQKQEYEDPTATQTFSIPGRGGRR